MAELGRAALVLTFGLVVYALVAGVYAAAARRRRLARSAQNALLAAFVSTAVAAVVLWAAFARRDFSFAYVADHSALRPAARRTGSRRSGAGRRARSCCGC